MNSYNVAAFNSIKTVKESLTERFSSNQLVNVLDDLLLNALTSIAQSCDYLDSMSSSCLVWYNTNTRRKISSLPKDKVLQLLMIYPIAETKSKVRILKKLRLERNIRFFLIESFMQEALKYSDLEVKMLKTKDEVEYRLLRDKMHSIQTTLQAKYDVGAIYRQVKFWYDQAIKFRNQIMEKYMRHTAMSASMYFKSASNRLDLSDVVQNFQLALNKAINKFDQRKGTLTSYINHWLRHARSAAHGSTHEYGIAYVIPGNVRKDMASGENAHPVNIFVPMHTDSSVEEIASEVLNPEEVSERDSEIDLIRTLAKQADPTGLLRMQLGIEEILCKEERNMLYSSLAHR